MGLSHEYRWRVEAVQLDRGTGLRPWFEVHHGGGVWYCATATELAGFPADRHVDPARLAPPGRAPVGGEDGCE